ncbi:MAG: hypothetical protein IKR57_01605 [Bacilli bacterium]|nr:hypothetical protein [Bacilli bacterium]MBR6690760.1 hypothetical protein [Bacilli bacterium]
MIKFKGYDLTSKGIIDEDIPKVQKPKKRIDIYNIYGRNGFLSVDNNTYDSYQIQVGCHIKDNANMDEIAKFLDGYGTISFDNIKQSTAIVNNNIEFNKIRNSGFKKFMLSFLVNPIFEDIEATIYTPTFSLDSTFYKATISETFNYNVYPSELEIEIASDTDFYINNRKFSLKSGHYYLDCKNKEIYDSNHVNKSSQMSGDFPYLDTSGTNTIKCTTSPTTFKITCYKPHLMG